MYQPRYPSFSISRSVSAPSSVLGQTLEDSAPRGQALQSLAETDSLRSRFFSWRGASGRRYVCSVFQSGEDSFVADVTNGVVIGVAREGATTRPVCVFLAQERSTATAAGCARSRGSSASPNGMCIFAPTPRRCAIFPRRCSTDQADRL